MLGMDEQLRRAQQIQGLSAAGAGPFMPGRIPLELGQVNARIEALQEQITELDRKVDELQQLKQLMQEHPTLTEMLHLAQKVGML
jgi:TolA-binding protein